MEKRKLLNSDKMINAVLIISIIMLGLMFIYINLVQYRFGLNADIAAEGLLARVIWESREWIPKEWYFSTESKVIGVTNLASLFYGMTGSMCTAMGLGCIAGILFIVCCLYYLCHDLELSITQTLLFTALILLLPNNKNQIELLYIYAGYYAFHIGLYFITLSFYCRLLKGKRIKWYGILLLCLLHFMLGAQGVRGILMITGPLLAVEAVRRIYLLYCKGKCRKEDNLITVFVGGLNVVAFLGGKIPISVGYPLSRNIRKAPQKLFEIVLPDFFDSISWKYISLLEKAAFGVCLMLVLGLIFYIIRKGIKKKNVTAEEWIFLNFAASVFLTIAALTFTTVDSSSRYFVVIYFAMAMAVVILWNVKKSIIKYGFLFMMLIILTGNGNRVYRPMILDQSYKNSTYMEIGNYLLQEGYENAYTGFEHANTITIMNDGKVQVSAIASFSDMGVNKWLSSKKWYVPNVPKESRTAYLVTEARLEEFAPFLEEHEEELEYKTKIGDFYIYGSDYNYSKLTD